MESTYIPSAPQGYAYHKHLFSDLEIREKYPFILLLILANFIALIPLALGVILLWLPYQFYLYLGAPYAFFAALEIPLVGKIIVGATIFFASMLFHEWLHGVALQMMGHKAHYAFHKLFLTATIEDGDYLNRRQYLLMTVTPLIVMSIGGGLLLLILPPVIGKLLLISLLINTAASIGDLMVAVRVYRMPKDAVFTDDKGIQVFLPEHKKRASSETENAHIG